MNSGNESGINFKKIGLSALAIYIALVIVFYFLAGDQLLYRNSRGSLTMPPSDAAAAELTQGVIIEQRFQAKIQRLESVSVQWGTYYRPNSGTVRMELLRVSDGNVLMEGTFDAASIAEGQTLSIQAAEPVETAYDTPLLLRLSSDALPGSAVTPLVNTQEMRENFALTVNSESTPGTICFSAAGTDYIWTGLHYWEFATGFGILLALGIALVWYRWKKGKHSYVVYALTAMKKYRFLIRQLVSRDFKIKYKRSVLGVFWSFLNPLLTMVVQYLVFSNLFRFDLPYYQAYLIIGIVFFNFFSESTGMALGSIIGNAGLITKVYVPKYIYPLTRVLSTLVNLTISLIPLLLVTLLSGCIPTKAYLLVLFVLVCLTVFCLGIGMLLSAAMVFFRDIQFLWGVLSMIWMYLTPIFYPANILPENVAWVLDVNPMYQFITFARTCFIDGISPEPIVYVRCALMALGALLVGALVFRKSQDRFVLYL